MLEDNTVNAKTVNSFNTKLERGEEDGSISELKSAGLQRRHGHSGVAILQVLVYTSRIRQHADCIVCMAHANNITSSQQSSSQSFKRKLTK